MDNHSLAVTAAKARRLGLDMVYRAASGHLGGSFSALDLLTLLYQEVMRIDPARPQDPDRDRFVLSKGHCTPGLYPTLALRGYFPEEELKQFRSIDGHMSGHAEMHHVKGVDMSTGSLGQGISIAVGMALGAKKLDHSDVKVYTLLGDGELQEGQVWEASMAAAHYGLDNLTVIIDNNGLQIDGRNDEVMSLGDLPAKLRAFGFDLHEIDGHDLDAIAAALDAPTASGKPKCILAHTVKGKGVSFMADQVGWHGKAPNEEQRQQALKELED